MYWPAFEWMGANPVVPAPEEQAPLDDDPDSLFDFGEEDDLTYYMTILFSEYMMSSVVTNSMDSMPTNFSIQWRRMTLLISHFFFERLAKDATTRH